MNVPDHVRAERLADGIVHVLGITLSVIAAAVLLCRTIQTGVGREVAGAAIYSGGLLAMFGFSAVYNMAPSFRWNEIMRRCDHSAIYIMIAGTFTPFALLSSDKVEEIALLILVWLTTACGVILKLAYPRRFERVSLVLYLTLGWAAGVGVVVAGFPSPTPILLIAGGVLYTIGVVFFLLTRLRFQNAIWHGFVLAAALCHFGAVRGLL